MSAPLFELHQVTRRHSDAFCLEVPLLEVRSGETLCLLGPNGAGKSTLLRLLSALESPTAGQIFYRGTPQATGPWPLAVRRSIVAAAQHPVLLSGTAEVNVQFGLRTRGRRDAPAKARQMLERLNVGGLARQQARTLSGGQTQLVALARALVIEPEVLLLDEPTAHLDPAHVALVERVVQEEQGRAGTTIVWATHNLFQARRMGTRTAFLLGGKLIEVAPTDQLFDQPADERTAAFVQGTMIY